MAPLSLTPSELEDPLLPKVDRSEIVDRLAILRIQERTTYHIKDYITDSAPSRKKASKPVDADCRIKMCEWVSLTEAKFYQGRHPPDDSCMSFSATKWLTSANSAGKLWKSPCLMWIDTCVHQRESRHL